MCKLGLGKMRKKQELSSRLPYIANVVQDEQKRNWRRKKKSQNKNVSQMMDQKVKRSCGRRCKLSASMGEDMKMSTSSSMQNLDFLSVLSDL